MGPDCWSAAVAVPGQILRLRPQNDTAGRGANGSEGRVDFGRRAECHEAAFDGLWGCGYTAPTTEEVKAKTETSTASTPTKRVADGVSAMRNECRKIPPEPPTQIRRGGE
jgi:hypothetical protein